MYKQNLISLKSIFKSVLFIGFIFTNVLFSEAQNIPEPITPPRLVNDFVGLLPSNEITSLENALRQFNNETSTQIYIVTVKSLGGYDIASFAAELGEKWGIGQKSKNNGLLILVKVTTSSEKGEVFIATGYGLEGVVPDAIAKRIVENEILPYFRKEQYYNGLASAVNTLMSLTKGEFTADQYNKRTQPKRSKRGNLFPIIFIILIVIISSIGGGKRGRHNSLGRNLPFWLLMSMMMGGSSSSRGSFGGFSSGSGGFGGFGGGGGGSFGGGGAGGSW